MELKDLYQEFLSPLFLVLTCFLLLLEILTSTFWLTFFTFVKEIP